MADMGGGIRVVKVPYKRILSVLEGIVEVKNDCHSPVFLWGIFHIRFSKYVLGRLLNVGKEQKGDSRQRPSGMTLNKI